MTTITLREVLTEVNKPNSLFDIKYRKADGEVGTKLKCVIYSKDLNERKKRNRSGLLKVLIPKTGEIREVYIDLLVEFNGMRILHFGGIPSSSNQ